MVRRWAVAVSLGVVACGKSANDDSTELVGVAGSAASAPTSAGATATAGGSTSVGGALSTPIAGSGAAAVANGAGGAASSAGAAGSAGRSAAASGGGALGPDPQPADAPVAVVATSSNFLVFQQGIAQLPSNTGAYELMLLDLQGSAQPVQVNAAGSKLIQPAISGDGRFLIHEQVDPWQVTVGMPPAPRADDLQLAAFTDSGYVPGTAVAGFEARPALHYPSGFDGSSRFAAFVRPSEPTGFDIVDAANNTRYTSLDVPGLNGVFWAPKGYLFAYRLQSSTQGNTPAQFFIAKLVDGGISEPQPLPSADEGSFTADGRRFFYRSDNGKDPLAIGYVDPPAAPQQIYLGTRPNGFETFQIEAGGQSLLMSLIDANDPTRAAVTRIFVDPMQPPLAVSEPSSSSAVAISESHSLAALTLVPDADGAQRLEFLRGTEHIKVVEAPSVSGTFTGEHLIYYLPDPNADLLWEVHSATLVGSSVVDRRLAPADHHIISVCQRTVPKPGNKYIDVYDMPVPGIRFSDLELDGPSATRTFDATDPSASVDCAVCNAAEDACAYVERTDASSKIFVVHFGPTGPSAATLVFESDRRLVLSMAHLP